MKTRKNTYTLNDYNSQDGMLTNVWGPALWHVLHIMSFNYPINPCEEDKYNYMSFIINLQYTLPCKYCRDSYMDFFTKLSPMSHLGTRKEITKWLYDIHNLVNDKFIKDVDEFFYG